MSNKNTLESMKTKILIMVVGLFVLVSSAFAVDAGWPDDNSDPRFDVATIYAGRWDGKSMVLFVCKTGERCGFELTDDLSKSVHAQLLAAIAQRQQICFKYTGSWVYNGVYAEIEVIKVDIP